MSNVPSFISSSSVISTAPRMSAMTSCAQKPPVLVADVLGTLVKDPFYHGMSRFFGFKTFEEFLDAKTPHLWVDFELGKFDETQVASNFFKDGTPVDLSGLKQFLKEKYDLLPGVPEMLKAFQTANIPVHLCTNYPVWAYLIEDTLHLTSRFGVKWTFISGEEGVRKPDKEAYLRVAHKANIPPSQCIFLDDRKENCLGSLQAGYLAAVHFKNAEDAFRELKLLYARENVNL